MHACVRVCMWRHAGALLGCSCHMHLKPGGPCGGPGSPALCPAQPVWDFPQRDPQQRLPPPLEIQLRQPWLAVLDVCSFPQVLSSHSPGSSSSDPAHARCLSTVAVCVCTRVYMPYMCALEMTLEPIECMCVHMCTCLTRIWVVGKTVPESHSSWGQEFTLF